MKKEGFPASLFEKTVNQLSQEQLKLLFDVTQKVALLAPSTKSLFSIGEQGFSQSIHRLGSVDFFSVISRKPVICDFKPVQIEVAIARLKGSQSSTQSTASDSPPSTGSDSTVQVLRFANRVPLQFDRSACAIVKSIESVNWKAYGLAQARGSLPQGSYVIAVSVVSPFIKFKNASKETIDASEDLVAELRKALIQAGQKLFKHIRKEQKALDLEKKIRHIEQFCPILIDGLCRITKTPDHKKKSAQEGLIKILGRDATLLEAAQHAALNSEGSVQPKEFSEASQESKEDSAALKNPENSSKSSPKTGKKTQKDTKNLKAAKRGSKET
jgi:DNA topoisomerase-6 subunit B